MVGLLECGEGNLEGRSIDEGKVGDTQHRFANLGADMEGFISLASYVASQISGAGGNLKSEIVEACLSALNLRRFLNYDRFFRFWEISLCRSIS